MGLSTYNVPEDLCYLTQQQDGSWHGDSVGKVYGTAIAATIMQLPYALVPIYQR